MRISAALLVIALPGCVGTSETYMADGRRGYVLNCSGTARSWGVCLEKAGELCGASGYDTLERSGDSGWTAGGSNSGFVAGSVVTRIMLIACKP